MILGISYFFKESITVIMKPFIKPEQQEEKPEWKDKYYRNG
jgi:hypothetical protein